MSKEKKKMVVKVVIDFERQELGVSEVKVSSNTNIGKLMPEGGAKFLSLVFKQLSEEYENKAKKFAAIKQAKEKIGD